MSKPEFYDFEKYKRITVPQSLAANPGALYDLCTYESVRSLDLATHYSGKQLSAVTPLWDMGVDSCFNAPVLKLVSAGNNKPVMERAVDEAFTRVCAEQNLIDNALKVGDYLLGVLFIRSLKPLEPYEGNAAIEAPHLCGPCRQRAIPIFGENMVVVSFVGDDYVPNEATTIYQQKKHHEHHDDLEVLARGKDVKDYVIQEVFAAGKHGKRVDSLPLIPSRRYARPRVHAGL